MADLTSLSSPDANSAIAPSIDLAQADVLALAQALADKLTIRDRDWHRLKSNRSARAQEQAAVALVYLLKNQPEEALVRLQQATGWLDRTLSAPPCPTHGTPTKPVSDQKN